MTEHQAPSPDGEVLAGNVERAMFHGPFRLPMAHRPYYVDVNNPR